MLQHTDIFDSMIQKRITSMYYIYHIKGVKFGCTNSPKRREKESRKRYGKVGFDIIEQHEDIEIASIREAELNAIYKTNDRKPYSEMISMREKVVYPTGKDHHNYGMDISGVKNPNYGNIWSDEQRENLSRKNSNPSKNTRKLMSEAWKNREPVVCPHCGKQSISAANMKRWHFDNCKAQTSTTIPEGGVPSSEGKRCGPCKGL